MRAPLLSLATLAFALSTAACAPAVIDAHPSSIVAAARARGLDLQDPLALDRDMEEAIERKASQYEPPNARVHDVLSFIRDDLGFEYTPSLTLTAREAYRKKKGDCMAFTHLFVALARHVGLPAYFVHVSDVRNYYERGGSFFVSSHVAAGIGHGPESVVVDVAKEITDWRLSIYEAIDDANAAALYYDNIAVDRMLAGDMDRAEAILRFLADHEPKVPEFYNNLGVLLNRRDRHVEALAVIQRGLAMFPTYEPLYTNGIRAADGAGMKDVERDLERRGQELSERDPFFLFARGITDYNAKRFARSIDAFERASSAKPDSVTILTWLTRAQFFAGKKQDALATFERAERLAPGSREVRQLVREIPDLAN